MKLDEKALNASCEAYDKEWLATELHSKATAAAIRAYLASATPPDAAKIARSLEALAEHLSDQPLTHADSTDLATIRQAATALCLSAGGWVPEGWKLVPVEPTPEMLGAFWRQKNCGTQEVGDRGPHTDDYSAYRAMLAASPAVEAGR